jgi:hypothetical protein
LLDAAIGTRPAREAPAETGEGQLETPSGFPQNLRFSLPPFGARPGCAKITLIF